MNILWLEVSRVCSFSTLGAKALRIAVKKRNTLLYIIHHVTPELKFLTLL